MSTEVPCFNLNDGNKMPMVGLGLWKIPRDVCADTVYEAIKIGYRLLDGACDYGNEKEVGLGIKRAIDEGIVKREQLYILSKLWNTFHRPEHVLPALQRTLSDLQVDYLDCYLIHFPISLKYVDHSVAYPPEWKHPDTGKMEPDHGVTYEATWHAMEELKEKGLVRSIGVSNLNCQKLVDIIKYAKIKPAILQIEGHPFLTQEKLLRFCKDTLDIQVMCYSNLGSLSYVELGMATADDTFLLSEEIKACAAKYNKTPAQIALRWGLERKTVVIPKSTKLERLRENIDLFSFQLTEAETAAISKLDKHRRFNDPGVFCEAAFGTFYPIYD